MAVEVATWAMICVFACYETRRNTEPWELIAALGLATIAFAGTRRVPAVSLAVASLGGLAVLFDYSGRFPAWPVLVMLAVGFLTGTRMDSSRAAFLVLGAVGTAGLPLSVSFTRDGVGSWVALLFTLLFAVFVPWHFGRYLRLRNELTRSGWRRAEELEARQAITADQARLRERARIAGDMHDSLGHELSLIALRAASLELAPALDERSRVAAGELRESAAAATERLRRIIGVLREDPRPPTDPLDGGPSDLIERARASGMVLESRMDDDSAAPVMIRRAAYRVVQEGLTNVTKHAPGAAVTVRLTCAAGATTVAVRNDAPPAGAVPVADSGRHGLAGLRERVRLLGGTLAAGPAGDGFEVTATLPHDAAPAPAAPATEAELSESARERDRVRRKADRTLFTAVAIPAVLAVVGAIVSIGYYVYSWSSSRLDPASYDAFGVGLSRVDIEADLPRRQSIESPEHEPPAPRGAACEYYGTAANPLIPPVEAYRLCFADGVLVAKDLIADRGDQR